MNWCGNGRYRWINRRDNPRSSYPRQNPCFCSVWSSSATFLRRFLLGSHRTSGVDTLDLWIWSKRTIITQWIKRIMVDISRSSKMSPLFENRPETQSITISQTMTLKSWRLYQKDPEPLNAHYNLFCISVFPHLCKEEKSYPWKCTFCHRSSAGANRLNNGNSVSKNREQLTMWMPRWWIGNAYWKNIWFRMYVCDDDFT